MISLSNAIVRFLFSTSFSCFVDGKFQYFFLASSTSEYLHLIVSQYFDGVDEATILSRVETKLPNYERLEYINAKEK